jgi:hypothetical protein
MTVARVSSREQGTTGQEFILLGRKSGNILMASIASLNQNPILMALAHMMQFFSSGYQFYVANKLSQLVTKLASSY